MRSIFSLLLIWLFAMPLCAQPIVPKFAVEGARWYYKNIGKNNDVVKYIYVERNGDSVVNAYNFKTKTYEDITAFQLVFHYLDKDSTAIEYDTLYVRADTAWFGYYLFDLKIFNPIYSNLTKAGINSNMISANPFIWTNHYIVSRQNAQKVDKVTCATVNNLTLGFYKLQEHECYKYPIGDTIIERIGSTSYLLRFDSCSKEGYGGPLLWYYDPELGLYEQGKTKVALCKDVDDSVIVNSIADKVALSNSIKAYPVPFAEILNLEIADGKYSAISIYSIDGKCFYINKLPERNNIAIDTKGWPAGIYIVKQQTANGIAIRKISKQ